MVTCKANVLADLIKDIHSRERDRVRGLRDANNYIAAAAGEAGWALCVRVHLLSRPAERANTAATTSVPACRQLLPGARLSSRPSCAEPAPPAWLNHLLSILPPPQPSPRYSLPPHPPPLPPPAAAARRAPRAGRSRRRLCRRQCQLGWQRGACALPLPPPPLLPHLLLPHICKQGAVRWRRLLPACGRRHASPPAAGLAGGQHSQHPAGRRRATGSCGS
jgi:hypothetical protein